MEDFKQLFTDELAPAFYAGRELDIAGLKMDWSRISPFDAANFMRTWRAGMLTHEGQGHYRMPRSHAVERFFWEGEKKHKPQPVSLWIEPIVTVATLARIHFDYRWPIDLLGMQSKKWEFDLTVFPTPAATGEAIACEVKPTKTQLNRLIAEVREFGEGQPAPTGKAGRNSYKKYLGLIARRAPIFWAVAPAGYESVFRVEYSGTDRFTLAEATTEALRYRAEER